MIREARVAVWLSGMALAAVLLLAVYVWLGPAAERPCPACVLEQKRVGFLKELKNIRREDLCPECLAEWD